MTQATSGTAAWGGGALNTTVALTTGGNKWGYAGNTSIQTILSGGSAAAAGRTGAFTGGTVGVGGTLVASGSSSAAGGSATSSTAASTGGGGIGGFNASGGVATSLSGAASLGGGMAQGGSVAVAGSSPTSSTTVAAPSITSVNPASGIVNTTIVIVGQSFGATQGTSTVTLSGESVTPTFWSDTAIELPIPRTAYPGTASIVVNVNGRSSNGMEFEVRLPRIIYINKADSSTAGNAVSAFSLTAYGFVQRLQNSPFATGDRGGSSGLDSVSLALHRATRRLFAVNAYSLTSFDIDPITGQLTRIANSPVNTGAAGGTGVVVNAAGTMAYVTNQCALSDNCRYSDATISIYRISTSGVLTLVSGSPFMQMTSGGLRSPALVRGGQLLVVSSDFESAPPFNALVVNSVSPTTGLLTPVEGSPFGLGTRGFSGRADPTGSWYYLTDNVPQLTGYGFTNNGTPVLMSGMPVDTRTTSIYPNSIAISPNGAYLYLGLYDSNQLSGFALGSAAATLLPGSPFTLDGLSALTALAVTSNNSQLVVADATTKSLLVYSLSGDGLLGANVQGGTFEDVGGASGLVIAE